MNRPLPRKVLIIGAGVSGLGIGWRLAQQGVAVTIYDKGAAGSGASHAAAGMLAACVEAEPGEENLVALGRASQAMWPDFAAELRDASGIDVQLRPEGTLVLALTPDDQARLQHGLAFQRSLNLPVEWLSAAQIRQCEPYLSTALNGGIWSPQDHQVDNRLLARALHLAAQKAGVQVHEHTSAGIALDGDRVCGVTLDDGNVIPADAVVLAAGAWSKSIAGLPKAARPPVRPIKGQMLALQMKVDAPILRHVVWAPGIYLAPRLDGRLILGATVEEKGFDTMLTAGGVLALLEAAWRVLPAIEELPIADMWVGHRPGSRDDAPILGKGLVEGLFYATGHHRNGILLCPITASSVAEEVLGGAQDALVKHFSFQRFIG
jgi:glycine oxidase